MYLHISRLFILQQSDFHFAPEVVEKKSHLKGFHERSGHSLLFKKRSGHSDDWKSKNANHVSCSYMILLFFFNRIFLMFFMNFLKHFFVYFTKYSFLYSILLALSKN